MPHQAFSSVPVDVPRVETRYRRISTPIPAPGTDCLLTMLQRYESRAMQGQMPIIWDRAEDFSLYDIAGNRWIDFTSTIFVANVGHGNARVREAVRIVLDKPLLHTYAYASEYRVEYCQKLVEFAGAPFEKVFLLSAGSEATEAALKLMRMNGQRIGKRRPGIICVEGNWHGRTLGAQMMSGNAAQKEWIGYHDPNIHHIPFPYPWALEGRTGAEFFDVGLKGLVDQGIDMRQDICGFMLETFQGWGCIFYAESFVQAIEEVCAQHDILLTFDEMQSGFGRTGRTFGYEHYGVQADLLCVGKGMAAGFPLSGVIGTRQIMDLPEVGNMSSTHSANPIVCAAGTATLEVLDELDLINETRRKGGIFSQRLAEIQARFPDRVSFTSAKGLIGAVLFQSPETGEPDATFASRVSERAMQAGLLVVHTGRESIKLGPPLTIPDAALNEAFDVLEESIEKSVRH